MVTSCVTIDSITNTELTIGTIHQPYSDFICSTGTRVCVYMHMFSFMCLYYRGRLTTVKILKSSIPRIPPCHPYSHSHLPPCLSPTPGNHRSVFHLYNFVISKMLYKWNHRVYDILRLPFFLIQHNSFAICSSCYTYQYLVPYLI